MEYQINFILVVHSQHQEQLLHSLEFLNVNNLIYFFFNHMQKYNVVGTNFLHVNLSKLQSKGKTDPIFNYCIFYR
jgi:hypothetical protein